MIDDERLRLKMLAWAGDLCPACRERLLENLTRLQQAARFTIEKPEYLHLRVPGAREANDEKLAAEVSHKQKGIET